VAQTERDIGDRRRSIGQKQLGNLHAPLHLVLMRWDSERLFERPAKMMQAQSRKSCKFQEADLLSQMRFNVVDDRAFLPTGETSTPHRRLAERLPIDTAQLVGQHARERLQVRHASGLAAFNRVLQFGCRLPDEGVLEIYSWQARALAVVRAAERSRIQ